MTQQVNLYHAGLRVQRQRWRAVQGFWVVSAVLAASWALAVALDAWSARRQAEALRLEQLAAVERAQLKASAGVSERGIQAELDRLRVLDAGQRRVQAAVQAQLVAFTTGYTPYFFALSRQAQPSLWITGLGVNADGQDLMIQGRMTDPSLLPGYLRRLNAEPQFKGRDFAQLTMKAGTGHGDAPAGYTEFLLKSQPAGRAGDMEAVR